MPAFGLESPGFIRGEEVNALSARSLETPLSTTATHCSIEQSGHWYLASKAVVSLWLMVAQIGM